MPKKKIGNYTIDVDDEGFLTNLTQWNKDIAAAIAKEEGIAELTPVHWKVIEFMQKDFKENSAVPTIRKLNKMGVIITVGDFYEIAAGGHIIFT